MPDRPIPYKHLPAALSSRSDPVLTSDQKALIPTLHEVPDSVQVGTSLRYIVELRNEGDGDVSLNPCPVYYQAWGESGTSVSRVGLLNCANAPDELDSGESVRFEMKLPITRAELGGADQFPGTIVWYLGDPHNERSETAFSDEVIVK